MPPATHGVASSEMTSKPPSLDGVVGPRPRPHARLNTPPWENARWIMTPLSTVAPPRTTRRPWSMVSSEAGRGGQAADYRQAAHSAILRQQSTWIGPSHWSLMVYTLWSGGDYSIAVGLPVQVAGLLCASSFVFARDASSGLASFMA